MSLTAKVEKLLDSDFRPEHSDFQIEQFIVGGSGHPWARYKQALRELATRHEGIEADRAELRRLRFEIKQESRFGIRRFWIFGNRRARRVRELRARMGKVKRQHASRMREYCRFYALARELKRQIGHVTPARRRELEAEAWVDKARRIAAVDLISIGSLQRSTAEFIASFPREERRMILDDLKRENRQRLLAIIE